MKTIWKYPIDEITDQIDLQIPEDSIFVAFQVQNEIPCIWMLVDPKKPLKNYRFYLFGTGHEINPIKIVEKPLGTVQLDDGSIVIHLFRGCN
jgi:hypothetical protein